MKSRIEINHLSGDQQEYLMSRVAAACYQQDVTRGGTLVIVHTQADLPAIHAAAKLYGLAVR